ncbi:MAG: nucleotidyltransferase domain-containing protein [Candidatus Hydrogenedentes bacterium]|nr:nucleotidyltransferase domain-containing protein [Candidatus Hydrogenedentota bacterium]
MELAIHVDKDQLAIFCEKHHIVKLSFFGSVITDHFSDESDVDVLVNFHPDRVPGMLRLCGMERELSGLLGRKADMRTPNDLSHLFRDEVVRKAVVQYAA